MINSKGPIVFLVNLLSQPRCIKRITSLFNDGYKCIVYGYDRGQYDVNLYPSGIEVHSLGALENGEYIKKFNIIRKDVNAIVRKYKKSVLYYSFGFAQTTFLYLKKVNYAYEISDVWYAYPKLDILRPILKKLDEHLIRHSVFTLMTSGGFKDYFKKIDSVKILVQPNKVSPYFLNKNRNYKKVNTNLTFGFVGSIRYENIFMFAEVIGEFYPQYSFDFYGGSDEYTVERVNRLVKKYNNIRYWGKFKSPEDLSNIYNNIDIVVACYDCNSLNEQIAEPNKLYEALYFAKPIIVSDGIYLARRVNELNCGFTLDASSKDNIIELISGLTIEIIESISNSEKRIPKEQIIDNSDNLIDYVNSYFEPISK